MNEFFDGEYIRERIRQLIDNKGVSDAEVGRAIGKSKSRIGDILAGRSLLGWDAFFSLCDYFEITPGQFFDYEDEMPAATRAMLLQLQRHFGKDFENLPKVLANIKDKDLEALVRIIDAIRNTE